MRVLIEGEIYPINLLKELLGEKFYTNNGKGEGKIEQVGYFHSQSYGVIYLLPKIFVVDAQSEVNQVRFIESQYSTIELAENNVYEILSQSQQELNWLKKFLIYFYKSLKLYKNRYNKSDIAYKERTLQLNTSVGDKEYTYLDLILSLGNFYKKNKATILFKYKENQSNKHKKTKWAKTVRKTNPFISGDKQPIYINTYTKQKNIDNEEELLALFFSTIYHLKKEYQLNYSIDSSYVVYKGSAFNKIERKALKILKRIRYKYFSDSLVEMHKLMTLYFSKLSKGSIKKEKEDYIMVKSYHWVFEDMVDKLFSDDLSKINNETEKKTSLSKLKNQKDGKEVDHLFLEKGLIDIDDKIFYVGDSKYYKTNAHIGENSIYKQFTYAKNIIQFNIDLFNSSNKNTIESTRYRDKITEGYNITPNFFIQGVISNLYDFDSPKLEVNTSKNIEHSYHWEDRLFDRDSLFINYYTINFLYVLKTYSLKGSSKINSFRNIERKKLRLDFSNTLNDKFNIKVKEFDSKDCLKRFVDSNFRTIIGRCYSKGEKIFYAEFINQQDDLKEELDALFNDFK